MHFPLMAVYYENAMCEFYFQEIIRHTVEARY